MANDHDSSFEKLRQYFKMINPVDVAGRFKLDRLSRTAPDAGVVGRLLQIFVDTVDQSGSGLLTFDEIKERVWDLAIEDDAEKIKNYVKLVSHDEISEVLALQQSKNSSTRLSVTQLKTPVVGFSLRDSNKIGVFMNAIPTLELSRCVPLLEVGFDLAFPGDNGDPTSNGSSASALSARSPTLLRYLNGTESAYTSSDKLMAQGSLAKVDLSLRTNKKDESEKWKRSSSVQSGMELFTTPQTLVSPSLSSRQVPVLDRFAPLMSIESFEVTATPSGGAMYHKTARLNLVIHDRSRLHEVAALLRPDAYSRTTVSISYGWSHPDRSDQNSIANLINQMIVRDEKYNIVNSSFSFGGSGGAKVVLQLATKGANEMSIVRIADSEQLMSLDVTLQQAAEAIRDARSRIPGLSKSDLLTKDLRAHQIIDAAADNEQLLDDYQASDKEQLRKLVNGLKSSKSNQSNSAAAVQLQNFLVSMESFLDGSAKRKELLSAGNADKNKTPTINSILGEKFDTMIGRNKDGTHGNAPDPFLDPNAKYWTQSAASKADIELLKKQMDGTSKTPRQYVSLAKLLLHYVGVPLQSVASVDEVQFVYYPFNSEAGFAVDSNLGSFPVEVQYFRDVLTEHMRNKRNANITIREFVQLLASTVLQDVRNPAYGIRQFYAQRNPKDAKPTLLEHGGVPQITEKLREVTGGNFRKPVVEMQVECRGGRPLNQGEVQSDKSSLRIVRIHVYDKLSSVYEPTLKVLEVQQRLAAIEPNGNGSIDLAKVKEAANLIGLDLDQLKFRSYDDLKEYISQVVPVLRYGSNNSGILAATVASMQNQDLATVNMQRAMGQPYNSEPNGSSTSALPLRVQPSQLDITTIGCPLLTPAQQYFVDFGTGTTLDDLYVLNTLSHRIAAGKFESTAKLTPLNAYGSYESVSTRVKKLKKQLEDVVLATRFRRF